jgi:rhomboid protease GluP
MSAIEQPGAIDELPPDGLVEAGIYPSASQAAEHGLVVLAAGHPYWLVPGPAGHRLLVERGAAEDVRHHLAAYARERVRWPPPPIADHWNAGRAEILTPLLWSATVLAIFHASGRTPRWMEVGALDSTAVFVDGEWWRIGTALFLHGDAAHVISNALSGLLVFAAVLSTFGRARGWLLLAIAAVMGNFAVAAANYPAAYRSVGASTAIFAGIGLLTGRAIRVVTLSRHPHRWRSLFVPLAAGLTVLGLYGAGGLRVDVGAHLTGFIAGLIAGFVAGLPRGAFRRRPAPSNA